MDVSDRTAQEARNIDDDDDDDDGSDDAGEVVDDDDEEEVEEDGMDNFEDDDFDKTVKGLIQEEGSDGKSVLFDCSLIGKDSFSCF
tara:strand:+ start:795 stop:1052 length:258 start_codon:yes stop_codon:yes gene_type:complete